MPQPFSIRDLLTKGAEPTTEDAANLKRIAEFVSRYFASRRGGLRPTNTIGSVGMEPANTKGALASSTVGRWTQALGSGASMLAGSRFGSHWDHFSGVRRDGYGGNVWNDAFFEQVTVVDEDGEVIFQDQAPVQGQYRRRQASLFGPRKRANGGLTRKIRASNRILPLLGGDRVDVRTLQAMADGGLRLVDQVLDGTTREDGSLNLDGVVIDDRTPALRAGIEGAQGGLLRARDVTSMLSNADGVARLEQATSARSEARPVYSFFDSVEGDFLALTPEVAAQAIASSEGTTVNHSGYKSAFPVRPTVSQSFASPAVSSVQTLSPTMARSRRTMPAAASRSVVRLDQITRSGAGGGALTPNVRPYVAGVFGVPNVSQTVGSLTGGMTPGVRLIRQLVRDKSGKVRPRVQRSSLALPRLSYQAAQSAGTMSGGESYSSRSKWMLEADGGPDVPLGAVLGDGELFAGDIISKHPSVSAFEARTMVGMTGSTNGYGGNVDAIDGVSWVMMSPGELQGSEARSLGLSLVPEGRPATMVQNQLASSGRFSSATPVQAFLGTIRDSAAMPRPVPGGPSEPVRRSARENESQSLISASRSIPASQMLVAASATTSEAALNRVFSRGYLGVEDFEYLSVAGKGGFEDTAVENKAEESNFQGRSFGPISATSPMESTMAFVDSGIADASYVASSNIASLGADSVTTRDGDKRYRRTNESRATTRLRNLLRRPVATARESRSVSKNLVQVLQRLSTHTPALARALGLPRMLTLGEGPGSLLASTAVVEEIGQLPPHKRSVIAQGFMDAGWSNTDLRMLQLENISESNEAQPVTSVAMNADATQQNATSERIVRNLARVLTGTEALLGSLGATQERSQTAERPLQRSRAGQDSRKSVASAASISNLLPLVRTKPSTYFGALAPEKRVGYSKLSDALNELVALAASEQERSDRPLTEERRLGANAQFARVRKVHSNIVDSEARRAKTVLALSEEKEASEGSSRVEDFVASFPPSDVAASNPGYDRTFGAEFAVVATQTPLESRLADALEGATKGPAGIERLLGRTVPRNTPRQAVQADSDAGVGATGDVKLTTVLAPEVMLHGVTGVRTGTSTYREMPGALAVRTDIGRESQASSNFRRGEGVGSSVGIVPTLSDPIARTKFARAVKRGGGSRQREGGLTPQIIGRILSRLDERQDPAVMSRTDSSDFALAWLRRVDGQLSGIDTGLDQSAEKVASFFGLSEAKTSSLAGESPVEDAKLVAPGEGQGRASTDEDRSGLRSLGAAFEKGGRTGQQTASAVSGVDWGFVNTGSNASTSHVDMQALAASVMGASGSESGRMPLVAPAVKAVAQTAMRSSKSEEAPTAEPAVQQAPTPEQGGASGQAGGMDEKAMDQLAQEMAGRISRRLAREKDRRGLWA